MEDFTWGDLDRLVVETKDGTKLWMRRKPSRFILRAYIMICDGLSIYFDVELSMN